MCLAQGHNAVTQVRLKSAAIEGFGLESSTLPLSHCDPDIMFEVLSKLFITSLIITEYLISNIKLLGTDLFPLKFPLCNRIFT